MIRSVRGRSPRKIQAPMVTKIGEVKAIAVTSASGAIVKATKNANSEASLSPARNAWRKR